MKKPEKKKYEPVPEVQTTGNNKKVIKPWDLEYMIIDEKSMNDHSFFTNTTKTGEWKKDSWLNKYISVNNALLQINKIVRTSYPWKPAQSVSDHFRFAGKVFRLVNRDTGEIVPLSHNDKEYYAERTTGENPS